MSMRGVEGTFDAMSAWLSNAWEKFSPKGCSQGSCWNFASMFRTAIKESCGDWSARQITLISAMNDLARSKFDARVDRFGEIVKNAGPYAVVPVIMLIVSAIFCFIRRFRVYNENVESKNVKDKVDAERSAVLRSYDEAKKKLKGEVTELNFTITTLSANIGRLNQDKLLLEDETRKLEGNIRQKTEESRILTERCEYDKQWLNKATSESHRLTELAEKLQSEKKTLESHNAELRLNCGTLTERYDGLSQKVLDEEEIVSQMQQENKVALGLLNQRQQEVIDLEDLLAIAREKLVITQQEIADLRSAQELEKFSLETTIARLDAREAALTDGENLLKDRNRRDPSKKQEIAIERLNGMRGRFTKREGFY